MPFLQDPITVSLQRLEEAKELYLSGAADSTEAVLDSAQAILTAGGRDHVKPTASSSIHHEKPSDFIQRVMWAEVSSRDQEVQY